jgi:hypothetical protein
MAKAYIIIYHQCLPNFNNDLEASDLFPSACQNQDVIKLRCLIQGLCYLYDAMIQSVMATVALHKQLFTCYQKDGINNHTYHHKFLAHVETIKTYGGLCAVGVVLTILDAMLKDMERNGVIKDAKNPSDTEKAQAIKSVCNEYLGALMLSSSNGDKFGPLRMDLKNQFSFGEDCNPKLIDQCLSFLNRWWHTASALSNSPRTPRGAQTPPHDPKPEDALVFAQGSSFKKPFYNGFQGPHFQELQIFQCVGVPSDY